MYRVVAELREREKELNCLYKVTEALKDENEPQHKVFRKVVNIIPEGWQYPGICNCRITFEDQKYTTPDFFETQFYQSSEIIVDGNNLGKIDVFYSRVMEEGNPFLPEEQKLLNAISEQIAQYIFRQRLKYTVKYMQDNTESQEHILKTSEDEHWQWRSRIAHQISSTMDMKKYSVQAIYLIGSAKETTAGPASDLDLLVHFKGDENQKQLLKEWIDGWSKSLAVFNYQNTGYQVKDGLIDLHIITDEDIKKQTSYASMIGSHHNSARLLKKSE